MSTRVLTLPTTPQGIGRSGRRSEDDRQEATNASFNSFHTSDGRAGLFDFLHNELRISSDIAETYCTSLTENGYDDVPSLQDATEMDLKEFGVKIGHVRRIKRAVFSNCMRKERYSAGRMRRASELQMVSSEVAKDGSSGRSSIDGSLLSDFARQEMMSTREHSFDMDVADSKETLIRKQAEKIASLEAKLAHIDLHDSGESSRGGSADTFSRRLTAEERLIMHRERKMQEEKYKEQTGKWDAPPPLKKEPNLTKRKIEEEERTSKKSARKSLSRDSVGRRSPPNSQQAGRKNSKQRQSRSDGDTSVTNSERHHNIKEDRDRDFKRQRSPIKIRCDTCQSTRDCEEDVDNPGTFYCKSCWEEYESEASKMENVTRPLDQGKDLFSDVASSSSEVYHAIWIAHDNPQLGEKIIYSGPRRMECMLETKEPGKKDCVRIIVGDIDYSGKVQNAGIGNVQGVESEQGAECIRLRNTRGYYVDHNQVATRLSRDKTIYEFHLGDDNAHILTGKSATMSVGEFFKDCHGAIDVILDPQRDAGGWYPQKEARSGGRKIAPQFRSKGVGYIRLGDDMSENGLAFLSVNACSTFLSSVGTKKKSPAATKSSSFTTPKLSSHKTVEDSNVQSRVARKTVSATRQLKPTVEIPTTDDSDDESVEEVQNTADVLKQLQSADMASNMKWKDKAELISQLGKGASRQEWRHSRPQALNVLQDTLGGKNVNVHVVRSALIATGMIGISMGGELVSQISWKTIMIETIKLLKSKQCGTVAKTVLAQLHGRCFTLANSLDMVTHVLGLGMVASASKSKKSTLTDTPKPRKISAVGGNNIEVIEWLAETTERERNMDVIDPILETSSLNVLVDLFLSHADHRDQRCRKNVSDGLMHCILYGVKNLGMEMTRVLRMLSGLKETNPKGWNQIVLSAQAVLEDERNGQ
ncbi:hypothetical protein HJC23_001554 [Cyclotella cryptica]|uniref:SAM domain-containing protein n=1 Tax=Cyclotella cryptica TaxID=29204 RepID=A0ABD3PYK4_9STRA|eukprot:CCRYP_010771-RA/>CCRYP_010771-RA protein AED:0.26 eAED:0.25 QI:0/0/0/1/1/1/2/0/926